jgi:hypothetical protein
LQVRPYRLCPAARQVPITPKLKCSIPSPNFPSPPCPLSAQPHSSEFIILTIEFSSFYFSLLLNSFSLLYDIMIYTTLSPYLKQYKRNSSLVCFFLFLLRTFQTAPKHIKFTPYSCHSHDNNRCKSYLTISM